MTMNKARFLFFATLILMAACKRKNADHPITADMIKSHIAVLANDSLQGRKPFTIGETKATAYIAAQFKKLGLQPGNNGSYFQDVPMVEITSTPAQTMEINGGKTRIALHSSADFVASTRREVDTVQLKN